MRVLLVAAELGVGGAERMLVELAAHLRRRGDAVALVAAPGPLDADLAPLGLDRHRLQDRGRRLSGVAAGALVVARAVRRFRPDAAYAVNVKATAMAWLGARIAGRRVPLVACFHGVAPADDRRATLVLRRADRVACVADALAARLRRAGVPPERLAVIPNAVAPAAPLTPARRAALDAELGLDGGPVVATVGRLAPQKAQDRFVRAAAVVASARPDARFLIVGDGPLAGELGALAAALGLGDRLRLTGRRADARDLIARSDVLVLTSDWEGRPLVALEALAAGTPLVAPPVQGLAELLDAGAGLALADTDPQTVAAGVLRVLDGDAEALRRAGRRAVAEHRLEDALAAHAALLAAAAQAR